MMIRGTSIINISGGNMKKVHDLIEKNQLIIINLVIVLGVYNGWIVNKHYATDTYGVFFYGMTGSNLKNGRVVHWLIYSIFEKIGFLVWKNLFFTQITLCIAIAILSFYTYKLFIKRFENCSLMDKIVIELVCVLLFVNIAISEGWFYFPETCFGASISLCCTYGAFFCFANYYDEKKIIDLIKCFVLLLLALNMYQVYIGVFVAISLMYIEADFNGGIRYKTKKTIETIIIGGGASVITVLILKLLLLFNVTNPTERTSGFGFEMMLNSLREFFSDQKYIWTNFSGYLSVFCMIALDIAIILSFVITFFFQDTILEKMLTVLRVVVAYSVIFAPLMMSGNLDIIPRYCYGFFVLFPCFIMVMYFRCPHMVIKDMFCTLLIVYMFTSFYSIERMIADNIALNKIDQEIYISMEKRIDDYEYATGNHIDTVAFWDDLAKNYSYDSLSYVNNDTNIRALYKDWSKLTAFNYYTNNKYKLKELSEDEGYSVWGEVNYHYFDIESQMKFEGNTAYVLVY